MKKRKCERKKKRSKERKKINELIITENKEKIER